MQEAPLLFHISGVPPYVTYSWVAMIFLLAVALVVRLSLRLVPVGVQNVAEALVEVFLNFSKKTIGPMGEFFFPLIATLGMYILVCNVFGLIPGFEAPTSNLNTTASMAIPVFFATHYYGIKIHRFGYIKHFVGPIRSIFALPLIIIIFIIEVIGHLTRPLTLSVRLFGNMMAKHVLLLVLAMLVPWFFPIPILLLGLVISIVQTAVFVILSALYLAGAIEEAH